MTTMRERIETFEAIDGQLVRKVVPRRGEPYEHRCPLAEYRELAFAAAVDLPDGGFTIDTLIDKARQACETATARNPSFNVYPSFTNAAVTIAFWKERGLLDTRLRRNYPASSVFFEDAMCEFHALAEEPPEARDATSAACPTCGDTHPPCKMCGKPTRCSPDEVGEPFAFCDTCDADMS